MTWQRNRPSSNVPAAVKRYVRARARENSPTNNEYCELRLSVCRGEERLQYDRITPGSQGGDYTISNVRLVCYACHNVVTQEQAHAAQNAWKLPPERHPGLKW